MRIRIVCPVSCAYEGDAAFVSIPSTDGEFGVLPAHSSEICTIDRGYVRVSDKAMGTVDHTFAVAGGYAQVADDVVTVLAERACDLATVDADKVKADIQGFEEKLGNLSEDDARRAYLYNESHGVSSSLPNSQDVLAFDHLRTSSCPGWLSHPGHAFLKG